MARDFASRQRKRIKPEAGAEAAEKTTPKTRGAVPLPVEEEAGVAVDFWARLPGWGWLAIGLVAGFLVANLGESSAPTPSPWATPANVTAPYARKSVRSN